MAFAIGGEIEWDRIGREQFERACDEIGLNRKIFMKRYDDLSAGFGPALGTAVEKLAAEGFTGAEGLASRIMEHRREAGMQEG